MANLSVRAMELGGLTLVGATGSVLKRSLASMRALVDSSLAEVRASRDVQIPRSIFSLAALVEDARTSAQLEADANGCVLLVPTVDPVLRIEANRQLLLGALANLIKNAFKFTHRHTSVSLTAYASGERIHIDIEDRCGGLPAGHEALLFKPFVQLDKDRSGLGLGLSIARQNVESMGGALTVRNVEGVGCVFTIDFPSSTMDRRIDAEPDAVS
jgi:signal transduction histidine kinase